MRQAHHPSLRRLSLAMITVALATIVALIVAESLLDWYDARIEDSSRMEPGLLRYHERLGWTLTPHWEGQHSHHDFVVTYRINDHGFRGDFPAIDAPKLLERVAVVGDSFTFGLGVEDDATFVGQLNRMDQRRRYLNFGVPGYSTDQELLMLAPQVHEWRPDRLLLLFYLGNDLLDNPLPYPLQAEQAKPYFELGSDGVLTLRNVPVPRESRPAALRGQSLEDIVFGDALEQRRSAFDRLRESSRLVGRLFGGATVDDAAAIDALLETRLTAQKRLLLALLNEVAVFGRSDGIAVELVLLPGQSYVGQPQSYSSILQDHVRRFLLRDAAPILPIIDVAPELRADCREGAIACFHPHEGHYTSVGHGHVARALLDALNRASTGNS